MSSMLDWIIFAVLTFAVLIAVIWPLVRRSARPAADARAQDIAIYRDQLAEIDRDAGNGLISATDAEAARNEVKRRMLAASHREQASGGPVSGAIRRTAALAAVVAIPVVAAGLYLVTGSPGMPAVPLKERLANAVANKDLPAMMAQVEKHLEDKPDDVNGWLVLAPTYRRVGRFNDAAEAVANVIRLKGPDAALLADFAEDLTLGANGEVPPRARTALEEAVKLEPGNAKADFYLAMADAQAGQSEAARARWQAMLDTGPADAPWRNAVKGQLAALDTAPAMPAPGPTAEQMKDAQSMSTGDRQAMINSMVERLASKLAENGNDLDGWLRLARARMVLGQRDEAAKALDEAERNFSADETALKKLEEARTALGLPRGKS